MMPAFRRRLRRRSELAQAIAGGSERPGELGRARGRDHRRAMPRRSALSSSNGARAGGSSTIIGFHGQTVLHRPEAGLTVQLGDGALLARRDRHSPVVYDMRANDMAHGGQGAPLVPAYHAALAGALPAADAALYPERVRQYRRHLQRHLCPRRRRSARLRHRPRQCADRPVGGPRGRRALRRRRRHRQRGRRRSRPWSRAIWTMPFFSRSGRNRSTATISRCRAEGRLELADGARTLGRGDRGGDPGRLPGICRNGRRCGSFGRRRAQSAHPGRPRRRCRARGRPRCQPPMRWAQRRRMEAEAWAYLAVRAGTGCRSPFRPRPACRRPSAAASWPCPTRRS